MSLFVCLSIRPPLSLSLYGSQFLPLRKVGRLTFESQGTLHAVSPQQGFQNVCHLGK